MDSLMHALLWLSVLASRTLQMWLHFKIWLFITYVSYTNLTGLLKT